MLYTHHPMPKVEAKVHRHRQRPTPIPRPRFPTLRAEHHTYAFDRQFLSLRISGTGSQDVLSSGEARALYGFLRRTYEPAAQPTRPSRQARRARRHSSPQVKRADTHLSMPPAAEVQQKTGREFQEYNGWVNYPSWSVFTIMTSYEGTSEALQRIAGQRPGGRGGVRRAVLGSVEHWKNEKPTPYAEAARTLVQDFVMHGIRQIAWTPVYDTLRGERKEVGEANAFTTLAYQLLAQADWQAMVKDAENLPQADDLLRGWLEDQCFTWIASPDARKQTGSVGKFANTVLDAYFQVVQWEEVAAALRGE